MNCIQAFRTLLFLGVAFLVPAKGWSQTNYLKEGREQFKKKEYAAARATLEKGLLEGDSHCINYIGYMYLIGMEGKPEPQIALGYFLKSAELGNADSCRSLGNMYFEGNGVDVEIDKAIHYWELGKNGGSERAAFSLGQIYYLGNGVPKDEKKGLAIWREAIKMGSDSAKVAIASISLKEHPENRQTLETIQKLAEKGNRQAKGMIEFHKLQNENKLVVDIPFVYQAWNFCVLASGSMLLQQDHVDITQFDLACKRPNHQWGRGARWDVMEKLAKDLDKQWVMKSFDSNEAGYNEAIQEVKKVLASGHALMIDTLKDSEDQDSGHTVVIVGYDDESGNVLIQNPANDFPGLQVFTKDEMKTSWSSRGFIKGLKDSKRGMMYSLDSQTDTKPKTKDPRQNMGAKKPS